MKELATANGLARYRDQVLALDPEKAQDAILDHPQAADLVRLIPEQDFLVLVHEIGPEDAVPLLNLASPEQWEYLVDMEAWRGGLVSLAETSRWLELLFSADPARAVLWFVSEQTQLLELWLFNVVSIHLADEHDDLSGLGEGAFTLDGTLYARVRDEAESMTRHRDLLPLVRGFLDEMAAQDFLKYQSCLLESAGLIAAETQEEAFRLRNVRLAEKGFPPFEEAVGIYEYSKPGNIPRSRSKNPPASEASRMATGLIPEAGPFSDALALVDSGAQTLRLQAEFAALCNRLIVADRVAVHSRQDLAPVVEKACGYVGMGLLETAALTGESPQAILQGHLLTDLFRVGYGLVLKLKFDAANWRAKAWFTQKGLPLSFWGEQWLGVLGGILLQKPKRYDAYKNGKLYGEFANKQEIIKAQETLARIMAFDAFLSLLSIPQTWLSLPSLSYKNLVLTLWARELLKAPSQTAPLEIQQAQKFFRLLWEKGNKPRRVSLEAKKAFLDFLASASGQDHARILQSIGQSLEELFLELEAEYGGISLKNLDARYLPHLCLNTNG